jgi:hypothetical protein
MPLDELKAIEAERTRLEEQVSALKKEILHLKTDGAPVEIQKLNNATRAGVVIAQYAIANLSPEFSRRWPFSSLRSLAENMPALPDFDSYDQELALEMMKFANECENAEKRRAVEGERYVPEPPVVGPMAVTPTVVGDLLDKQ